MKVDYTFDYTIDHTSSDKSAANIHGTNITYGRKDNSYNITPYNPKRKHLSAPARKSAPGA